MTSSENNDTFQLSKTCNLSVGTVAISAQNA